MGGEREIRPKWPTIYTFLGRGKWWQNAAVCGLRFAVVNCKLPFLLPASYFVVEIASIC
jgi:hypothetical protein